MQHPSSGRTWWWTKRERERKSVGSIAEWSVRGLASATNRISQSTDHTTQLNPPLLSSFSLSLHNIALSSLSHLSLPLALVLLSLYPLFYSALSSPLSILWERPAPDSLSPNRLNPRPATSYSIQFNPSYLIVKAPTADRTNHIRKMPTYELRSGGDVRNKKQSVADLKYRRLTELNVRLKEDLDRPRVKVSEASLSYVLPLAICLPGYILTTALTGWSTTAIIPGTSWFPRYGVRYVFWQEQKQSLAGS